MSTRTRSPAASRSRPLTGRLVIRRVAQPGSYSEPVTAYNKTGARVCTFRLTVVADESPDLVATQGSQATLSVSNCLPFDCERTLDFSVSNATDTPAVVRPVSTSTVAKGHPGRISIALSRATDGRALRGFATAKTFTIPGAASATVEVHMPNKDLPAGQYNGVLYVTARDTNKVQALAVSVSVKDGLFWPLTTIILALLLRFALGRLAKTPAGQAATAKIAIAKLRRSGRAKPEPERSIILARADEADQAFRTEPELGAAVARLALAKAAEMVLSDAVIPPATAAGAERDAHVELRAAAVASNATDDSVKAAGTRLRSARANTQLLSAVAPAHRISGGKAIRRRTLLSLGSGGVEALTLATLIVAELQATYFNSATFGADPVKDYATLAVAALGTTAVAKLVSGGVSSVISVST